MKCIYKNVFLKFRLQNGDYFVPATNALSESDYAIPFALVSGGHFHKH